MLQPLKAEILGFQRGDANTRYLRLAQQGRDQIPQVAPLVVLGMVVPQVNASQHDLLIASTHPTLNMFNNRSYAATARLATHVRHYTVGAAIIATILHLHLHACTRQQPLTCVNALSKRREARRIIRLWLRHSEIQCAIAADMLRIKWEDGQGAELRCGNISCQSKLCRVVYELTLLRDSLDERLFRAVAHHQIDAWERRHRLRIQLRVAAGHDQERVRVAAMRLRDHLARTTVAKLRHRTGIDNIDIRNLREVTLHKARRAHLLPNGLAIGLVDLAAERRHGECRLL